MILVIDSNEYVSYLNRKTLLLEKVLDCSVISIKIHEIIVREVLRNIKDSSKKEFYNLLFRHNISIDNKTLPLSLFWKYKNLGLKRGDIAIASFCEQTNAEYLITENRHFLKEIIFYKLKVLSLDGFIRYLKK